jgi:predicted ATPase
VPFIRAVEVLREEIGRPDAYPYSIPALRDLERLELDPAVTFLAGENGSGKSTLVEAIAIAAGMNPEGGSRNFNFATRASHSPLHEALRIVRGTLRPSTSYFLRAESFFNVASAVDELDAGDGELLAAYGGVSLHEQSHGESFLALVNNRFGGMGLYVLDEPEAALSVRGCLALLARMRDLAEDGSQFLIATHSPLLLGYPDARIYALTEMGTEQVAYEDTEQYQLTRSFLEDRERFFRHLFG